jgi:DNA repair protein RecN (Recombination protein N)
MLTTLRIKNLALVVDLTLELQPGLNVITGETGAGKSVLIGALSLVLGERADRDLIRTGADSCSVEALFNIRGLAFPIQEFLDENGLEPCVDDQLIVKRSLTSSGTNRQFINGSPTTLNVLGRLGEWLVDIHGPHDHQSLLHTSRQLHILDAFGGLADERSRFTAVLRQHQEFEQKKADLIVDEKTYAQQLDLLRFQVNEITGAQLRPGEDAVIEQEHKRASNSARLVELSESATTVLAENENSILDSVGAIGRLLQDLQRTDPSASGISALHQQLVEQLHELQAALSHYRESIDVDPRRLQELEERLNTLQSLRRKYGPSIEEVIAFGEQARQKLESLEQRDVELERINALLEKHRAQLSDLGAHLSAQRRKVIPQLAKAVTKQLAALGFKQSEFSVSISTDNQAAQQPLPSGFDSIEFLFAPNPGEPPKPLRTIASSGELARVMLALKTVLAEVDEIPVLVFDEVDANVGGETAHAVGEKMEQISRKRQVICITHLPQVAAHGATHFVVTKLIRAGRTHSEIQLLDRKARVAELARMLGGQSEAATRHAQALLQEVS